MSDSLRERTISGMLWSFMQKFGTMAIAFVANIVLARLLTPDDYGCIGMLLIFIAVANTFIDGGFGSALIQKKEPTQEDYSTIFYWNLFLSIVLYGILFFTAPFIADFYEISLLTPVLRGQGGVLILNALSIIQCNQLRKQLRFRSIASVNLTASLLSVVITIVLAWIGWGIWALVAQQLLFSLFNAILFWSFNKWVPSFLFSKKSFKELFGFGGFILLSSLINTFCDNIHGVLIGKFFSPAIMGLYTQARKLEEIASTSISSVVNQVAYPVLSEFQNDNLSMIRVLQRFITSLAFLVFPLMMLLILIAKPLIILLYSDKWVASVPYFQILCIAGMAICLQMINYNAVAAIGRSDILLKWTIIKRSLGLILNIGGLICFGMYGLLWGGVLTAYSLYFINSYLVSRYVGYRIKSQIKDLFPIIITVLLTFVITYFLSNLVVLNIYFEGLSVTIIFMILYLSLSSVFNLSSFNQFRTLGVEVIKKFRTA